MTTLYDMHELEQLCERQRQALDELLKANRKYFNSIGTNSEPDKLADLREIYRQVSSLSTMTGSSEK